MANCEQTAGLRSKARAEVRRCCRGHSLLCCGLSIQQGRGGESHFSTENGKKGRKGPKPTWAFLIAADP
jgi:hypothetical protein